MKVNGIDIRKYNAKQLKADIQPPAIEVNYEWMPRAILPIEFNTDIKMGHLTMSIYFKGKDRNHIIRIMSDFMENFTKGCELELDGYKGIFKAFMTSNDYEKTITKKRYIINLEFDGFFFDNELEAIFDGMTSGKMRIEGTRRTPCILEIYAKETLTNYRIAGFGEDEITITSMQKEETLVIDGIKYTATIEGVNAFEKVDMWEFPKLDAGENVLGFSDEKATVKVRYKPMWI